MLRNAITVGSSSPRRENFISFEASTGSAPSRRIPKRKKGARHSRISVEFAPPLVWACSQNRFIARLFRRAMLPEYILRDKNGTLVWRMHAAWQCSPTAARSIFANVDSNPVTCPTMHLPSATVDPRWTALLFRTRPASSLASFYIAGFERNLLHAATWNVYGRWYFQRWKVIPNCV